jgi:hypothetical protein
VEARISLYARLRMTYSLRSNVSSSSISALRPMNTWRINGSQDFAVSPSIELFVGTVRQPSTV